MKEETRIFLNNDNDESREVVDFCINQRKTVVNPIIDWTDDDVWEFIEEYGVRYCELYDKGFDRLGCIGCPLAGNNKQKFEFDRYPKYKQLYIAAFDRMLGAMKCETSSWKTGEDVYHWWVGDKTV